MCVCVGEEAGYGNHFEDGRGVCMVSVRIPPKRGATKRKGIIADLIHSLFGSTRTIC
jgi:hypothetical protein